MRPRTNLTGRVGLWSGRHPWRAIGIWLAFIVIAVVAGGAVGTNKLHDVVALVVAAAALLGLAAPALSMHTATPGVSDLPHTLPVLKTYDRIMTEFPGGGAPAVVVITADDVRAPQVAQGIEAMKTAALASGQMAEPISVHMNDEHTVALVDVPLAGNGENAAATHALATLRDEVIPQTIGKKWTACGPTSRA